MVEGCYHPYGINFFILLNFYLLATSVTVYALEEFQASASGAGFASSIFVLGAFISQLLAGRYVESYGRRKLLLGGLTVFFLTSLLYFPANSLALTMIVRLLHGLAFGVVGTANITAAMDLVPPHRRGEGSGYFSLSNATAAAVGPFLSLFILRHADFDFIFLSGLLLALAAFAAAPFAAVPETNLTADERKALAKGFHPRYFIEPHALPIAGLMAFVGVAYSGILTFLNPYAIETGLVEAAGLYFVVYAVCVFVSRPLFGKLQDTRGDSAVVYPSLACFGLSLLLLSAADGGITLLLSAGFLAFGYATMISGGRTIVLKRTPRHRYGMANSTYNASIDSGYGVGPFLLGLTVPFIGYRGMFLVLAILVAVLIPFYYFGHRKHQTRGGL